MFIVHAFKMSLNWTINPELNIWYAVKHYDNNLHVVGTKIQKLWHSAGSVAYRGHGQIRVSYFIAIGM